MDFRDRGTPYQDGPRENPLAEWQETSERLLMARQLEEQARGAAARAQEEVDEAEKAEQAAWEKLAAHRSRACGRQVPVIDMSQRYMPGGNR